MADNFSTLASSLVAIDARISQANAKLEVLKREQSDIESKLLAAMQKAGTDIVRNDSATISISTTVRPQIVDIEALYKFILRRKALQLFERRIAVTAYRELKEQLGNLQVPGLAEVTLTRLNVRKANHEA